MNHEALISLAVYFVLMLGIGLYAYRKSTSDVSEYMLGGRQLHPAVGALSAGASDMSGWMLMGLPGAVFVSGFSAAWIAVGLVIGAYLNYLFVAPRLRVYTEMADDAITIPDFFEKRFHDKSRALRVLSSVVIVIFFTLYTSAGVVAGGKLFEASFGLDYQLGLFLTAGVVVAYTLFGGFLAVSLTDFVQGCIMFVALVLVPVVAISAVGGFDATQAEVLASPAASVPDAPSRANFFNWFQGLSVIGIISAASWGLGYFGQPHIIVRFMAIRTLKDIATARYIGMSWMIVTVIGAVAVGVTGVAYVNEHNLNSELTDPETIFILFSQVLFHPLVSGFLLAAILAAIMSTISSQLLVSSSSLTEDFYKTFLRKEASQTELVAVGRISVLVVSLVAIGLAFDRSSNILSLVGNAWAGFGAAFGPIILLSLYWRGLTRDGALAGMVVGAVTVLFWLYAPIEIDGKSLSDILYEIVPGFVLSGVAAIVVSIVGRDVLPHVLHRFGEMEKAMEEGSK
ncbi:MULTISPECIES: sodium/proline symporter PutP [Hyphomonas]|uniref:Sodium/proline symporter n=1 Tax=Hyphomonas adhaerens TaxID=81029 RepID=A0A3B9GSW9_9PROT|nr:MULTISPECIES: sodium/proline symporter PutP [Hyphomonas]MBB41971.1 sodium/proline symporter PutP [Hyphomonas sp.]HAE25521.1 sodium/proline symporter PutP [Hyphomonas adhaerens]|tara:strand:- start:32576 stop:34111 length:1536 start_codon:yes stop_codon:yes gene_type:complete